MSERGPERYLGLFIRLASFIFALALTGYEAVLDDSHHLVVYLVAVGFGGGPVANFLEAIFLGHIQINVVKKREGERVLARDEDDEPGA